MAKRPVTIVPIHWQHFLGSIVAAIVFPLLPLGVEYWSKQSISHGSLLIAAIMYISGMAIQTRSTFILILGFLASLAFSVMYGNFLETQGGSDQTSHVAWFAIAFFGISHAFDRYVSHIILRENFLNIGNNS